MNEIKEIENLSDDFKEDLHKRLNPKLHTKELNFQHFCTQNFTQIDEFLLKLENLILSSNTLFENKVTRLNEELSNLKKQNISLVRKINHIQNELEKVKDDNKGI